MEAFLGALEGETWRDSVWIFRDLRELAMDHGGQGDRNARSPYLSSAV